MKIAMWSGPRNLSTALMYSFAQRADCSVVDEPFYAAYLAETGLDHPMRDAILRNQPQDPTDVIAALQSDGPTPIQYQKHMTQHMMPGWDQSWMADVVNVFLIRHPARVIASYAAKRENPNADDFGFQRQYELYQYAISLGQTPIVVDSFDIRADPRGVLTRLCEALDIAFQPEMLNWPKGGNTADGIWAAHWYGAVHGSTGFAEAEGDLPDIPPKHQANLLLGVGYYERLYSTRI